MNDSLQATLDKLIQSGSTSNPALNKLISANTEYHFVCVVVGGLFLLAFTLLSIFFWKWFRKTPKAENGKWTFEKRAYFHFGLLNVVVGLAMALIVAANVNNVLNPREEFLGAISMLSTPQAGSQSDKRHQAFKAWLQSGRTEIPSLIQRKIDDRLAWQQPKAMICSALLVVFVALSAHIWRTLIRKSRVRRAKWKPRERALLISGVVSVSACLPLMLMVIGNTQGSFVPIAYTLFFG